jgi:crotonobetaine/carnitine-CoA ligase
VAPEFNVRVVDEAGRRVREGDVGELQVRPRGEDLTFIRYIGDPRASREAWLDGWFRTRDQVRIADGWLHVVGRSADTIRRRGINIAPSMVEAAIEPLRGVQEVAVLATPSELTEDEVWAVVVPAPGHTLSPADVWRRCRTTLPSHAVPRYISIESEISKNANLKVNRGYLRERGLPSNAWDSQSLDSHHREEVQ